MGATLYGRTMFYNIEITISPANGLCNVTCSKVHLQKKRSSPLHHLHTVTLLLASLIRNRFLFTFFFVLEIDLTAGDITGTTNQVSEDHLTSCIKRLQGPNMGHEFDTPAFHHFNLKILTLLLSQSSIDDLVFSIFPSNSFPLSCKISLLKNGFVTLFLF